MSIEGETFFAPVKRVGMGCAQGPWPHFKPDKFLLFTFKGCDNVKSKQEQF